MKIKLLRRFLALVKIVRSGRLALFERLVDSGEFKSLEYALPGHFYSPIPRFATLAEPEMLGSRCDDGVIELNKSKQIDCARIFAKWVPDQPWRNVCQIFDANQNLTYTPDNAFFPAGDAMVLYGMIRQLRPKKIVEVGCGYSTAAMLDTVDALNLDTKIHCIEPFPSRLSQVAGDARGYTLTQDFVQNVPLSMFESLESGDILFIDSSHVIKAGSDLEFLLFSVLPSLNSGVVVHFHDIFWPYQYPESWNQQGRAWNEIFAIRCFLMYNSSFEIVYFGSYMEKEHAALVNRLVPDELNFSSDNTPLHSSLWLRKNT